MPTPPSDSVDTDVLSPGRRRWVDLLLLGGGAVVFARGWLPIGALLIILGGVMPILSWCLRRRGGLDVYHLVPADLVESHRAVLAAAALPHVPDPAAVVRAADDA